MISILFLFLLLVYYLNQFYSFASQFCILKDFNHCGGEYQEFKPKSSQFFDDFNFKNTYPIWTDFNQDDLLDLIITYHTGHLLAGKVYWYENIGNKTDPKFDSSNSASNLILNISTLTNFYPGFGDIDGDGDLDAILSFGDYQALQLWLNLGNTTDPQLVQQFNSSALQHLSDDDYSQVPPTFVDIDQDGDLDMAFAQANSYLMYENRGNSSHARFQSMGRFQNPMNSISGSESHDLHFFDLDKDGDLDLFVGGVRYIEYHENYGNPQTALYKSSAEYILDIEYYDEPIILVGDINGDDLVELLVVASDYNMPFIFHTDYYELTIYDQGGYTIRSEANDDPFSDVYLENSEKASISAADLDGDGDIDILLGSSSLGITYFENIGNDTFVNQTHGYRGMYAGRTPANPAVGDLDGDGDVDVVVAVGTPSYGTYAWIYYENVGDAGFLSHPYGEELNPFNAVNRYFNETSDFIPTLFDLDADGDLDLVYATFSKVVTYWNIGNYENASFEFDEMFSIWSDGYFTDFTSSPKPAFAYVNGDNTTLYFIFGSALSGVSCYADQSTGERPLFNLNSEDSDCETLFEDLGTFHSTLAFVDFDNDGDKDVLIGNSLGLVDYLEKGFCTLNSECSGQGFCNTYQWTPTCTCEENQSGNQCEECADGYYGVDCNRCPLGSGEYADLICSKRGECDDGIQGTGLCQCNQNFDGDDCSEGTCPAGYEFVLNETSALYQCSPCAQSYYKAVAGNTECSVCPSGAQPIEGTGHTNCTCQVGYYWSLDNATAEGSCVDCAYELHQAKSSSVTTAFEGSTSPSECICTEDYYQNQTNCIDCIDIDYGVNCSEGSTISTLNMKPGYWRVSVSSATILACPLGSINCAGGTGYNPNLTSISEELFDSNYYCQENYKGPYCAVCEDGYFKSVSDKCIQCSSSLKIVGYIGIVLTSIIVLAAVWYLFIFDKDPPEEESEANENGSNRRSGNNIGDAVVQMIKANTAREMKKQIKVVPGRKEDAEGKTDQKEKSKTEVTLDMDRAEAGSQHLITAKPPVDNEGSSWSKCGARNLLTTEQPAGAQDVSKRRNLLTKFLFLDKGLQTVQASLIDGADEDEIIAAIRSKIKILLVCHQILVQFPSILSVDLPENFSNYLDGMDWVNLDLASIISWTCLANTSFYQQLLAITILPLVTCFLIFVVYWIHDYFSPRTDLKERYMQIFYALSFIMFGTCSTKVFQTFLCEDFDDGSSYLKADYSVSCNTSTYKIYRAYACCMLLVYPIGIPILYAVELYRQREDIIAYKTQVNEEEEEEEKIEEAHKHLEKGEIEQYFFSDKMSTLMQKYAGSSSVPDKEEVLTEIEFIVRKQRDRARLGANGRAPSQLQPKSTETKYLKFLYEPYGVHCWWFSVAECVRRLTLSGLLVFFNSSTVTQVIVALILAVFWLLVFVKLEPYQETEDNFLEQYVGVIIFITMFAALMVGVEVAGANTNEMLVVGIILVSLDGAVLIFGLCYFVGFYFFPKVYRLAKKYKKE